MSNRYTMNGPPGSAFHELLVLPTLAPQLARPANAFPPVFPDENEDDDVLEVAAPAPVIQQANGMSVNFVTIIKTWHSHMYRILL